MKPGPKDIILRSADYGCDYLRNNSLMPAGHNGPYRDSETPVRNNAHWAMLFIKAYELTDCLQYLEAAERCTAYLKASITDKSPVFFCRNKPGKDHTNGLIGQAWAIEPLMAIQKFSSDEDLLKIGLNVIKRHVFEKKIGLWKVCDESGNPTEIDHTFNHQLWFASIASYYKDYDSEVARMVTRFLDCIDRNLVTRKNGRIGQAIFAGPLASIIKPVIKKVVRKREIHYMKGKEVGYHAFNTYAFAMLNANYPAHEFWGSRKFKKVLGYLNSPEYRSEIYLSKYGFPYNPPAFEVLATRKHFSEFLRADIELDLELWRHQLDLCWDAETGVMSKGSSDSHTNAARVYECHLCC